MVPSQFLSVVLEEANNSGSDDETNGYSHSPKWPNQYSVKSNNSISDQEMWNLTKNLPKALLAECTVEISRTPINESDKLKKPCFDARVSPVFTRPQRPILPAMTVIAEPLQQFLPPPPQLIHRSEWMEESMDMQDLLTGVEAVYSDNESEGEYEEAASVSIFPVSVPKVEKTKPEKVKKQQDITKFSYPCEHCPNVYSNRGALWQHSVATHSVEKTCECKICGRKFYRNCSLALHLKSHSEEEYCQCKECGKSFNRLANLERHMRIHVDCEQFPCPHCDKVFRDKANLLRHIAVHTAPKLFQCEKCNKSYKSQDLLDVHYKNAHVTSETFLACSICGDLFKSFPELMQHDALHLAEKNLVCKLCGETFPDINVLKKHMLSHDGERLRCPVCKIDFTQKSSLLRHLKRLHPEESDDIIDPSMFLDERNSGLEEGSSDNGSIRDMETGKEPPTESNSTVEILKALKSPIKAGGMTVFEQQTVLNGQLSTVEKKTEKVNSLEIHVLNNNHVENEALESKTPTENSIDSNKTEEACKAVKLTNGDLPTEVNGNSVEDSSSVSGESKQHGKSESADPLTIVDINRMHSPALKMET